MIAQGDLIAPLVILISALFLLLVPLAFAYVSFFSGSCKRKRIVQIVSTVFLVLATTGVGFIWIMMAVVGGFQQLSYDMKRGQAELDFPMVVYYSPWYVIGLWIINLIIFSKDMFTRKNPEVLS